MREENPKTGTDGTWEGDQWQYEASLYSYAHGGNIIAALLYDDLASRRKQGQEEWLLRLVPKRYASDIEELLAAGLLPPIPKEEDEDEEEPEPDLSGNWMKDVLDGETSPDGQEVD